MKGGKTKVIDRMKRGQRKEVRVQNQDKRRTVKVKGRQERESGGQEAAKGRVTFRVFQRPQDSEADGIINSNFPASCSQGLWQKPLV